MYPENIRKLIRLFTKLPGIGPKTAERLVLHAVEWHLDEFADAFKNISGEPVRRCVKCYNFSINDLCDICANPKRDGRVVAVVAKPQDVVALEKSHAYSGLYHVLGGLLSPLEGIADSQLRIKELESRISEDGVDEVILAFDNNPEGDATTIHISRRLASCGIKITQLARGLPVGSDLEYADGITLKSAIEFRRRMEVNGDK